MQIYVGAGASRPQQSMITATSQREAVSRLLATVTRCADRTRKTLGIEINGNIAPSDGFYDHDYSACDGQEANGSGHLSTVNRLRSEMSFSFIN
jgi:hypothetical protein